MYTYTNNDTEVEEITPEAVQRELNKVNIMKVQSQVTSVAEY